MPEFIAYYSSPLCEKPITGTFEFQSGARLKSKANLHDARLRMLELFGNEALSWTITDVVRKKKRETICENQMLLDFREPKQKKRPRKTKEWW